MQLKATRASQKPRNSELRGKVPGCVALLGSAARRESVLFPGMEACICMFPPSSLFVTLVSELTHPSGDFFDYDE